MPETTAAVVPLNQTYRMARTFADHPAVKASFETFMTVSRLSGFRRTAEGEARFWGRTYDYACIVNSGIDFRDKVVADLGARDGFLGSWLTSEAGSVHVSDYFEEWGKGTEHDLGSLEHWRRIWEAMAPMPARLHCTRQDLRALEFPDESFDVVICTSVIEHINQHDTAAMGEIVRVCKPGGIIAISTDMSHLNAWCSGTFWYNEATLFARLIDPFPIELRGPHDFSLDSPELDASHPVPQRPDHSASPVVFTLRKY